MIEIKELRLFILAFMGAFTAAMLAVNALSFYGPANTPMVHLLLSCGLVAPIALVVWSFRREAAEAEQALRQAVKGVPASSQSSSGEESAAQ